jgi:hypothetical protein
MLGGGRGAIIARNELEDGAKLLIDIVALRQSLTTLKRDPGTFQMSVMLLLTIAQCILTLVFAISALNFLMDIFLDLPLEDSCARGLVEPGGFEDMCCIDPIVCSAAHDLSH